MKDIKFDLAINIINYNSAKYTKQCIQSVLDNTTSTISYEIIIVDNASSSKDYEALKNHMMGTFKFEILKNDNAPIKVALQ